MKLKTTKNSKYTLIAHPALFYLRLFFGNFVTIMECLSPTESQTKAYAIP